MTKFYLRLLLAALVLLCSTAVSAVTYSGTCGENVNWSFDTETGVLNITGTGEMTNFSGSSNVPWKSYRGNITTVNIDNGVTTIGESAFSYCTGLTSITIPNSVTTIENYAFSDCSKLKNLYLEDGDSSLFIGYNSSYQSGQGLFYDCPIETLYLGRNLSYELYNYYSYSPFYNKTTLTSITIGNSVTYLNTALFSGCTGITNIAIGKNVTSIGYYTFRDCTGLISIEIPNSVTTIVDRAFSGCTSLTSVTIPNSITTIRDYVFYGCTGLTNIEIPNSVTTIGDYVFYGCTGLTNIEIPNSVTTIGYNAFNGCTGLTDITIESGNTFYDSRENCNAIIETASNTLITGCMNTAIPNSVTSIREYALYGCTGLTNITIPNSVTSIGGYAFSGCTGLTNITISNSVTNIEEYTFKNCSNLTSITIPSNVCSIGNYAFSGCTALKNLQIEDSNESLSLGYNYQFSSSSNKIGEGIFHDCPLEVLYLGRNLSYHTDRESGYSPFYDKTTLTSITIGNSVTNINYNAFEYCTNLTSITLPSNICSIGIYAFHNCLNLKTVINHSSLSLIKGSTSDGYIAYYADKIINAPNGSVEGNFVFSVIDGVNILTSYLGNDTEITLPENYKGENYSIGSSVFKNNTNIRSITIPNSVTTIGTGAFNGCTSLTSVHISDLSAWCKINFAAYTSNPLYYAKNLYLGDSKVTDLIIPSDITEIKYYAFYNCTGLTNITIPNSVTSIGGYAFSGCTGLTSVTIPNSVTSIDGGTFSGCTGLTSITIPNSVTKIGSNAFNGCTGLTSVTIPNSVTSIDGGTFSGCTGLTSITIPNSVITIVEGAFDGCSYLKSVYLLKEYDSYGFISKSFPTGATIYTPGFSDSGYNKILAITLKTNKMHELGFTVGSNYKELTIKKVLVNEKETTRDENGIYNVTSLAQGTRYNVDVVCEYAGDEYTFTGNMTTATPSIPTFVRTTFAQTTMTFKIHEDYYYYINLYGMDKPEEIGIYINNQKYPANGKRIVKIENLSPDTEYHLQTYAVYYGETYYSNYSTKHKTKAVETKCSSKTITSTSLTFEGDYIVGDATLVTYGFEGYEGEGTTLTLTGLKPNTSYTVKFYVTTEEGGTITKQCTAKTDALVFNTLPAKATSNTRAVICAEANIANEESGTGFEWRRIDAPDIVPSNYAMCAVNDNVIEGVLNNLSANTYYKYRPYYCSTNGTYYYGEWIGFGTADAYVYFTPTVHTYTATMTAANSVRLYGYALAGSDDIVEQGFEYWTKNATVTRSIGEIKKVVADGQRMSVLLENLEYGMVYECRAYVKTRTETVYGETQTFTTDFATSIEQFEEDSADIFADNGILYINGLQADTMIQIFNMRGVAVYTGNNNEIYLQAGMYIVKAGDIIKKVIIE